MSAIDDFRAEYARQHPQRPPRQWSDEALVIAPVMDKWKRKCLTDDARYDPE